MPRVHQGAGVEFAVRGGRQRVDGDDARRHQVAGQAVGELGAQPGGILCGDGETDERRPRAAGHHGHRRRPHPGQVRERGLDLTEFDAVPPDLHLIVGTPEILQRTVHAAAAHEVAGAVQPPARAPSGLPRTATPSRRVGRCSRG